MTSIDAAINQPEASDDKLNQPEASEDKLNQSGSSVDEKPSVEAVPPGVMVIYWYLLTILYVINYLRNIY